MMLTQKQVAFLRKELETTKNPLYLYDSDGDGLASFLLLYRAIREGKGICVKMTPQIDSKFFRKVDELNPDKIFVLDIAVVEQNFIDYAKRPIFWFDHHDVRRRKNIHYYNPRLKDKNAYVPTTRMIYQLLDKDRSQDDLWIATVGCLADWYVPDFIDQFCEKYPHLLPKKEDLSTMVFNRPVGILVKMFFFLQKGASSEVRKSIKVLTRIKSPEEILKQETPAGRFLYRRFMKINKRYETLLKEAKLKVSRSKILLFDYSEQQWSFTTNLANELTALYPKKVIIIAREKSGEMKCSFRAQFPIREALLQALQGVQGRGGGHPNACGAVIKVEDWRVFLKRFKEELS